MARRSRTKKAGTFDRTLLFLIVVMFFSGFAVGFFFGSRSEAVRERPLAKSKKDIAQPAQKQGRKALFSFLGVPISKPKAARIAIVIDDVGYDKRIADLLWSLPEPVTVAILPGLSYSRFFSEEAKKRGFEVILHQPMEPIHTRQLEDAGMIRTSMLAEEISRTVARNLGSVSGAAGMNNHMGSLATQDRRIMQSVMSELKSRNMFFVDSLTTPHSVAKGESKRFKVPYVARDIFIDNESDPGYLHEQMRQLKNMAKRNGAAVGIGHYKRSTLAVIKDEMEKLRGEGFEIVPVRELV